MTDSRSRRRGGLPDEDDDLAAMSALARNFPPAQQARTLASVPAVQDPPPASAGQPVPETPAKAAAPTAAAPARPAAPAASEPAAEAPVRPSQSAPPDQDADGEDEPAAGGTEEFIKQSTVQVDAHVVQRFRKYQDRERPRPSNAEVIFRALDDARDRYRDIIDARRPQLPEGRHFGRAVPGRRPAGSRLATQINFRPTVGEEAEIKQLSTDSGADSMSAFINAVLDEFLPGGGTRAARA
jgi:hypothetical protein